MRRSRNASLWVRLIRTLVTFPLCLLSMAVSLAQEPTKDSAENKNQPGPDPLEQEIADYLKKHPEILDDRIGKYLHPRIAGGLLIIPRSRARRPSDPGPARGTADKPLPVTTPYAGLPKRRDSRQQEPGALGRPFAFGEWKNPLLRKAAKRRQVRSCLPPPSRLRARKQGASAGGEMNVP